VLSNYYGHSWEALRKNESRFRELVTDAQSRYWRPYYAAIANMWGTSASTWLPHPILPNLPQKDF
ncbi:hypothetical protein, partial [Staphylococcus aureus]|uniref:hypothetical protein n=1 Tax=Staphylococcus aureus TaxID=1280 RepID=UPI001E582027